MSSINNENAHPTPPLLINQKPTIVGDAVKVILKINNIINLILIFGFKKRKRKTPSSFFKKTSMLIMFSIIHHLSFSLGICIQLHWQLASLISCLRRRRALILCK
jgi:hypothetical protein